MSHDDSGWFGDLLLGHESRQRRDIDRAAARASEAEIASAAAASRAASLQTRVDRLELICEALLHVILKRGLCSREELTALMTQIDLRDGVEDGASTGDAPRQGAPLCRICELPINLKREACVYCDTPIERGVAAPQAQRTVRTVRCSGCDKEVEEHRTYYTGQGVICERCNAGG